MVFEEKLNEVIILEGFTFNINDFYAILPMHKRFINEGEKLENIEKRAICEGLETLTITEDNDN